MNVNDATETAVTGDRLKMIFDRQRELMEKYHDLEVKNGVTRPERWNVDDPRCQYLCKDFAWRVTEELAEAYDAWSSGDVVHEREELADSMHFLTELFLLNGLDQTQLHIQSDDGTQDQLSIQMNAWNWKSVDLGQMFHDVKFFWMVTHELGMAMNCLKNKPWKQSHMETDVQKFRSHLIRSYALWFLLALSAGMTADDVFNYYFKKAQVNAFRQRSQY
jgi:hypothetical protein